MKRVLIAESVDQEVLAEFSGQGVEFVYMPDITPENLEVEIGGFDGLIVRPKAVGARVIANADKLKLIIRGGAGVNSIALDACRQRGIIVANTPGLNSDATAEFTIAMMLQLAARRQAARADLNTRAGDPGAVEEYMGHELKNKKLGLIGLGNIGQLVARIAEAFGMEIIAYARRAKDLKVKQTDSLDELLKSGCDIISLHIPLTADTENLLGKHEFSLMKEGTILINTARPQLIGLAAFTAALASGKIAGFAIDGDYDLVAPFAKIAPHKKGIITHHIADATYEARANITRQALMQAVKFFTDGEVLNRVN